MYTPEEIKEEHDMPDAEVTTYGDVVEMEGMEVASFLCRDASDEFVIIATQRAPSDITTSRFERSHVIKAGHGDFDLGVLASMKHQVYQHLEDLVLPD